MKSIIKPKDYVRFFSYEFGSFFGGYWDYFIFEKDKKYYLKGYGCNGVNLDVKGEIPTYTFNSLEKIIEKYKILEWNKFNKNDENILDGYSFKLKYKNNNINLSAQGYMKFPFNYKIGHKAISTYLEELVKVVPSYILQKETIIHSIFLNLEKNTFIGYMIKEKKASYYHGDTYKQIFLNEFHDLIFNPNELIEMATNYYNIHSGKRIKRHQNKKYLSIEISDNIFVKETFYVYPNEKNYIEFNNMATIILSYLGLDISYIGSKEHSMEKWREQFITTNYLIYDRKRFGEIIVNLPNRIFTINNVAYKLSKKKAEMFYKLMEKVSTHHSKFQINNGIFDKNGFGYVKDGEVPIQVYNSYKKEKYLWIFGTIHKDDSFLTLYGGDKYENDWNIVVGIIEDILKNKRKL